MATVDELARDIVGSLALSEAYLIAVRWVDNRYKQMVSRVRFKHLRKIGEVQVPATYDTGTITTTRDSTAVVGVGSAWDTTPGNGAQTDWWIKPSSAWYNVASITNDTNLVLSTAFSEDSVAAGSYALVKRTHSLTANARWLGDFMLTRLRILMGPPEPLEQLDRQAPGRILTGQYPLKVSQVGVDASNYLRVEFYPYSAKSEIVHYVYWDLPTELTITSTIPAQIDPYVLKEGAMIDAYRYLKSKARMSGDNDAANSWGNDEQRQQTRWEKNIQEAQRTDQGADDKTFILSMYGGRRGFGDIATAHDHVLSNWSYPS